MEEIIELIRIERAKLKKTQSEMDEYVGVSTRTTYKLESGKINNCRVIEKYLDKCGYRLVAVKLDNRYYSSDEVESMVDDMQGLGEYLYGWPDATKLDDDKVVYKKRYVDMYVNR